MQCSVDRAHPPPPRPPSNRTLSPLPPSSSSSNRLVRSASSNVFSSSSSSSSQSNGGPPSTSGRRVLRSVSQDVRFKLESIKEEKKVTKAHVSELANFWKGKMISPKDKS
ncbi:hypothetical protein TYRP_012484 [Tyrophagus putrescentiae]|nr:hypothetical protein TYRP_012484 [Tyrophagus putrescentiae]